MKGKTEQNRQEVIKEILCRYGSVDQLDITCFGVRFGVSPEVITEDVRNMSEALQREAQAQKRSAELAKARQAEMELARAILKNGGA
jgi:hypothetical protein